MTRWSPPTKQVASTRQVFFVNGFIEYFHSEYEKNTGNHRPFGRNGKVVNSKFPSLLSPLNFNHRVIQIEVQEAKSTGIAHLLNLFLAMKRKCQLTDEILIRALDTTIQFGQYQFRQSIPGGTFIETGRRAIDAS